jgi:hypothetical protein
LLGTLIAEPVDMLAPLAAAVALEFVLEAVAEA